MSIEKKSLISTLKTTKKANVAAAPVSPDGISKIETSRKAMANPTRKAMANPTRKAMANPTRKAMANPTRKALVKS